MSTRQVFRQNTYAGPDPLCCIPHLQRYGGGHNNMRDQMPPDHHGAPERLRARSPATQRTNSQQDQQPRATANASSRGADMVWDEMAGVIMNRSGSGRPLPLPNLFTLSNVLRCSSRSRFGVDTGQHLYLAARLICFGFFFDTFDGVRRLTKHRRSGTRSDPCHWDHLGVAPARWCTSGSSISDASLLIAGLSVAVAPCVCALQRFVSS